jgi:glycerophosphoryl diester phosphodiesterase
MVKGRRPAEKNKARSEVSVCNWPVSTCASFPALFAIVVFSLGSCKKANVSHLTNLNNNVISVLGHRGSGVNMDNTYPMNTLESIESGIDEMGADGVEIDAQLSKDKQLILYHDDNLLTMTSFSGLLNSYTQDQLNGCLINPSFFNDPLKSYRLASLESVFDRFKNYSPPPICFIDIKPYYDNSNFQTTADYNGTFTPVINSLILKYNRQGSTLVSSGNEDMLQRLKAANSSLKLILDNGDFNYALQEASALGLFGITIHYQSISQTQMEIAHEHNLRVILWGVNTKQACRDAANLFPDYVETDNVAYMLSLTR